MPDAKAPTPLTARFGAPRHVAIIMDGNGRWAAARGLPRSEGHRRGVEALRRTVRAAGELGIRILTIFSFSSENWLRPPAEVRELMILLRRFIRNDLAELHKYGGRQEIARAAQRIAEEVARGQRVPEEVTAELIANYLDAPDLPDPDLVIRTSGEQRLSNFLLWQAAYSEFVFLPIYWPDFDGAALEHAIAEYRRRERRFGGLIARTGS